MKLVIDPNWLGSMCVNSEGNPLTKEQINEYAQLIIDAYKSEDFNLKLHESKE